MLEAMQERSLWTGQPTRRHRIAGYRDQRRSSDGTDQRHPYVAKFNAGKFNVNEPGRWT